ncbi:MAG TPA: diaminopimelate decarboxylase [Phycisphaerae bacterium]|nr:diaminopimelate decarboxylase [Phycisphaerae bacterium]
MDRFEYREGRLYCEDLPAADLARRFGTPLYLYSAETLRQHYRKLASAFAAVEPLICYSVKVCSNIHILRLLKDEGCGFDIVSGGELHRVIEAGGDPATCCYAGVAKTDDEIRFALDAGILLFNVESEAELENLARLAQETRRPARAALRVNPDVDPKTHRYVATGKKQTKFGVDLERADRVFRDFAASTGAEHVALTGIQAHIGSQITTVEPYVQALEKIVALIDRLRAAGHEITTLDFGGGFGADYETGEAPQAQAFASAIVPVLEGRGLRIIMEPGRFIAGNAGILITQVQYVKAGGDRTFLLCDSGMHQLIRPALYGSYHHIWPLEPGEDFVPEQRSRDEALAGTEPVDVVGPICESSDFFAKDRHLPPVARGDYLAVFCAGAYGMAMASEYNSFPRPAEVLVEGAEARLIRRRGTYADLTAPEKDV